MSLFGSLMGDFDDDVFGSHLWQTRNMMNSFMSDPFGMLAQNALMPFPRHENMPISPFLGPMPGFNLRGMFDDMNGMTPNGNCHSFMSQSVMTMASGPDGRPQVYQETMSTRTAPGGIKETKQTVSDSRTGTKKMAIGHHIGERAHILERERNLHNGDEEERQEFINLDEDEAASFNHEWVSRTRRGHVNLVDGNAIGYRRAEPAQLALPSTTTDPSANRHSSRSRWVPSSRRAIRSLNSSKLQNASSSRSEPSQSPMLSNIKSTLPSANVLGARRRDHKPYKKVHNKRHTVPNSDN